MVICKIEQDLDGRSHVSLTPSFLIHVYKIYIQYNHNKIEFCRWACGGSMSFASLWPEDLILTIRQCIWGNLINNSTVWLSHLEAVSTIKRTHVLISINTAFMNMLLGGRDENWVFALKLLVVLWDDVFPEGTERSRVHTVGEHCNQSI